MMIRCMLMKTCINLQLESCFIFQQQQGWILPLLLAQLPGLQHDLLINTGKQSSIFSVTLLVLSTLDYSLPEMIQISV